MCRLIICEKGWSLGRRLSSESQFLWQSGKEHLTVLSYAEIIMNRWLRQQDGANRGTFEISDSVEYEYGYALNALIHCV